MNYISIIDKICEEKKLNPKEEVFFANSGNIQDLEYMLKAIKKRDIGINACSQFIWKLCKANYLDGLLIMIKKYVELDKAGIDGESSFWMMHESLVNICKDNNEYALNLIREKWNTEHDCLGFFISLLSYIPSNESLHLLASFVNNNKFDQELIDILIHSLPSFASVDQKLVLSLFDRISKQNNLSNQIYKSIIYQLKFCANCEAISILRYISKHVVTEELKALCNNAIWSVRFRKSTFFSWLFNTHDSW